MVAVCTLAAIQPSARRAALLVTTISVLGFLVACARAGLPPGPPQRIAFADLLALAPLAPVARSAWRHPAA